jgi:hypothetical protein
MSFSLRCPRSGNTISGFSQIRKLTHLDRMTGRGLFCGVALVFAQQAAVAVEPYNATVIAPVSALDIFASAQSTYNDNIYNLPADVSVTDIGLGNQASRADLIETGAIGLNGDWQLGYQEFFAQLQVDYNRFQHNGTLNNASTDDKLQWNWRVGPRLSGKLYSSYGQGLASFANTRFFSKDIVKTTAQYGEIDWEVGPHWILKASGRRATTAHSAELLSANDFNSNAGTFGLNYVNAKGDEIGWEYRRLRGSFPHAPIGADLLVNRAYSEDAGTFHADYQLTGKTAFTGRVGYLRRSYSNPEAAGREGDFSGTVWRAALQYQPGAKTQLVLSGWRELTAYIDAQSDYFVATGATIASIWNATEAIALTLSGSREREAYVSTNPGLAFTDSRRDEVTSAQGLLVWTPRTAFSVRLAYHYTNRDSTAAAFDYKYDTYSLELRLTL